MFDRKRAAEYLVVAWCREWKMGVYLDAIAEESVHHNLEERLDGLIEQFPWLPQRWRVYQGGTREFVAGAYPKLSEWLWSRADDAARLKCAPQIERLKCPERLAGFVSDEDRREMKKSSRDMGQSTVSYRQSREAFKTHQRSAWNVCK